MESAFLHARGEIPGVDLELVGDVQLPRPRPRFARTRGCPRLPARYARGHPRPRAYQGGDGAPRPGGGARPGVVSVRDLGPAPNLRTNWAFSMSCGAFSVRLAWAGSRAGGGASYFPNVAGRDAARAGGHCRIRYGDMEQGLVGSGRDLGGRIGKNASSRTWQQGAGHLHAPNAIDIHSGPGGDEDSCWIGFRRAKSYSAHPLSSRLTTASITFIPSARSLRQGMAAKRSPPPARK